MRKTVVAVAFLVLVEVATVGQSSADLGREVAIPRHMHDGEEFRTPIPQLVEYGRRLFTANWTIQEGAGRPSSKGTGAPLSDATQPLVFPCAFNRISGPDSNSCAGCHNEPYPGGGGDIVTNVFVLGQRFDFADFDSPSRIPTKSSADERGEPVSLDSIADSRMTLGMFGSGFIEMLVRQMTADLQTIRDGMPPACSKELVTKGVRFGTLARREDGTWDVSHVKGLPATSLVSRGSDDPPSLIVRPFHQAGRVVSLREFSNNAFNSIMGCSRVNGLDPIRIRMAMVSRAS